MIDRIQITPAGREVVEARRERDEARAEVERLQAQLAAVVRRVSEEEQRAATSSATGTAPQWLHDLAIDLNPLLGRSGWAVPGRQETR